MSKDRSRDDKRSVGSHEKMMGALGKAAGGWERGETGNGKGVSQKVIEETGEVKGVKLGKGHVYHSGTNTPKDEAGGYATKAPYYSNHESAKDSFNVEKDYESPRPKEPTIKINSAK